MSNIYRTLYDDGDDGDDDDDIGDDDDNVLYKSVIVIVIITNIIITSHVFVVTGYSMCLIKCLCYIGDVTNKCCLVALRLSNFRLNVH